MTVIAGLLNGTLTSAELVAGQVTLEGGADAGVTVTLAVDVLPVPKSEVTVTELFCGPVAVPVTFTEKVQLVPAAIAAPERLTAADLATAVIAPPPHEPVSPFGAATTNPEGIASVNAIPVRVVEVFVFVMLKVRLVLPLAATDVAPKTFVIVGGEGTIMLADAVPPVPPSFEVIAPVTLFCVPNAVAVTFTEMVQVADHSFSSHPP